jgi:hypothetical protein
VYFKQNFLFNILVTITKRRRHPQLSCTSGTVIFNGLLVFFTGLLYSAPAGLFKETAELRRIANDQRADLSRSITAAEKSADAAKQSATAVTAQMRVYVSVTSAIYMPTDAWRRSRGRPTFVICEEGNDAD